LFFTCLLIVLTITDLRGASSSGLGELAGLRSRVVLLGGGAS